MTALGDLISGGSGGTPGRLAGNTSTQKMFLSQAGTGSGSAAPAWSVVSGQYLCTPAQYAPATATTLTTSSATMGPVTGAATTVASGSNGGEISQVASWSSPSAGVLDVASSAAFPPGGGTFTVATSSTTATCTYTGTAAGQLTGVAYVSGSATGTVATGGAVTLTSAVISTGSFTAPASGSVVVTAQLEVYLGTTNNVAAFGLCAHGTITPMVGYVCQPKLATNVPPYTFIFVVTGLTAGNSYNFDLMYGSGNGETVNVVAYGPTSTTASTTTGMPVTMIVQAV
jgi:hypothetical protein